MGRCLTAAGIDADPDQLGYPPHLTLAVYPDGACIDELQVALEQLAAHWRALPVALSGFGIFPGPSSVLWAAPVVTPEMLARHAALHAAVPEVEVHAHYQPGAWVPHVTLAGALRDPGRALAVLVPHWRPINGVLNRFDLVRFPPVEVLQSHAMLA